MTTIQTALEDAARALAALDQASPRLEAELLLAEALEKPRSHLFAWPERILTGEQQQRFESWLARRLEGEPIAYILGHREFWTLDLKITPAVLIPRPETELLVELALDAFPPDSRISATDLGTGSGAVAAALARERPHWTLYASDSSAAALALAEENFRRLDLHNVTTCSGDWCSALPAAERLALIVSNPPYVPEGDPHLLQGDLRSEPRAALAAGPDGLDAIRTIVRQAPAHLASGGILLLEHGFDQGTAVRGLLREGGFDQVHTHRDLAGQERVSGGRLGRPG